MVAVIALAVIAFLAVVVAGLFFVGGKRAKRSETHAPSAEEQEGLAAGYAVDTGSSNAKTPRTSGGGDD